ncbi:MAG: hypothetical protein ACXWCX_09900, partial [Burkholderiales bacterium]
YYGPVLIFDRSLQQLLPLGSATAEFMFAVVRTQKLRVVLAGTRTSSKTLAIGFQARRIARRGQPPALALGQFFFAFFRFEPLERELSGQYLMFIRKVQVVYAVVLRRGASSGHAETHTFAEVSFQAAFVAVPLLAGKESAFALQRGGRLRLA